MDIAEISSAQWAQGGIAALLVGFAKTGVPGAGILAVPLMASAFGARESVGILLPILIGADCFAVVWYRRHAQWDKLLGLVPWVAVGIGLGALLIWQLDRLESGSLSGRLLFAPLIGGIVLLMLLLLLLRRHMGERLTPHPGLGIAAAGAGTGIATTLANAAGPIMTIYLASKRMPKEWFMGTTAWFFLLLNCSKVPIYLLLGWLPGGEAMIHPTSLGIDAILLPLILPGVLFGRWLLPRLSQAWFDRLVLWLAAATAVKLLLEPWL